MTTAYLVTPFIAVGLGLGILKPILIPISVIAFVHAWAIPELYAARGANVLRSRSGGDPRAERAAVGLLGDLLGHRARDLHARTGLVLERGRLGIWVLGEAGAVLVQPHRVHCYCVKATDGGLPAADRVAHLLLALREDETGFVTVANLAFSGAPWRLRRRLRKPAREALAAGVAAIRP
jgi:hypothetical protein